MWFTASMQFQCRDSLENSGISWIITTLEPGNICIVSQTLNSIAFVKWYWIIKNLVCRMHTLFRFVKTFISIIVEFIENDFKRLRDFEIAFNLTNQYYVVMPRLCWPLIFIPGPRCKSNVWLVAVKVEVVWIRVSISC